MDLTDVLTVGSRFEVRHPVEPGRKVMATVLASYYHPITHAPTCNVKTDDGYWVPLVPTPKEGPVPEQRTAYIPIDPPVTIPAGNHTLAVDPTTGEAVIYTEGGSVINLPGDTRG